MANSKIVTVNGRPQLCVSNTIIPACAYVTYFDERNRYDDFAKVGYRLFSVTVSFASRPVNSYGGGFAPHQKGIFDNEGVVDFSCLDEAVERILKSCPNAYIFPRLYITMPKWWCEKHPEETLLAPDGETRELLFSDRFRQDASEMLKQVIAHIQSASYADNIIGYHLAGGRTEEWFHFGTECGRYENEAPYFVKYLNENYPNEVYDGELPDKETAFGDGEIEDPKLRRYMEFLNVEVAKSVALFAKTVKETVNYTQTVGVFYGYTMEVCGGFFGDLAIDALIDCEYIDFFCSPNSYYNTRALGVDWGEMIASGSVKSRGKLCLAEGDIRTSLSDFINNCRPGADKSNKYYGNIWLGPKTIKLSTSAMRKSFAHQITRNNGLWWFDMWGGWYAHPSYMREAKKCLWLCQNLRPEKHSFKPEIAIFADGELYQRQKIGAPLYRAPSELCNAFGNSGIPYEIYLLRDFEKHYREYKAIAFPIPVMSDRLKKAIQLCKEAKIPYLLVDEENPTYTPEQIRAFAKQAEVFVFCDTDDVIYVGNGLLGIHAATKGKKTVRLPQNSVLKDVYSREKAFTAAMFELHMEEFETRLFTIQDAD